MSEYESADHGELTQTLNINFDNYFLQHVDMPKNIKVDIVCLEAYNSNNGAWEPVENFDAGKNKSNFEIELTAQNRNLLTGLYRSAAWTTLMTGMGGHPYNNENNTNDPGNGKLFRLAMGKANENGNNGNGHGNNGNGHGNNSNVTYTYTYYYDYYFLKNYYYSQNSAQTISGDFLGFWIPSELTQSGQKSFWVIKIAAAEKRTPDDLVAEGRVFCEDMGANDFDFNDVVFDAWIYRDGRIKIKIQAHGGVLDIKVADRLVELPQMSNTSLDNTADPYEFEISAAEAKANGWTSIDAIPVQVVPDKNAENAYDLTAQIGQAPQKICVPINTPWPDEYVRLERAYTTFSQYVNICDPLDWTFELHPLLVDRNLSNNNE